MADEREVWSGVVLTPDEQARLDQHRAVMRDLRVGRRVARVPRGAYVDHLDGNPWNNDPANLRVVGPRENTRGEQ